MNKQLTIGIGTYGKKRNYIGRTLKSIIALLKKYRYTKNTVITVYNDDKQHSLDYITALKLQEKNPNLIICKDNGQNLGIAKTYQKMCFQCETPYFMQFDSDDIIGDFNIKQQIEFLQNNQQYCGSYGSKIIFDNEGKMIGFSGQQYSIINNKITINNNALILRVEDCKKTNMYFPEYYTNDTPLTAALDVVMWIGLILKKPLFFDRTVRTYGLDWQDGNHIKFSEKYKQQFWSMYLMLRKKYGLFSDDWTLHQKEMYYNLWKGYLTKQQKLQFWKRIGDDKFKNDGIFSTYIYFLHGDRQYQKMFSNMFLGLLKNDELKCQVSQILSTCDLIKYCKYDFLKFFNEQQVRKEIIHNKQWFEKFIKMN